MSTGEDEPSSGLNGRLRPRKSNASPKTTPAIQKSETKPLNEKPKRTATPSKVSPTKPDDFPNKTAVSLISQVLCSFCDKTFGSRQAVAKHVKRVHSSTSRQDFSIQCLYCNHSEIEPNDIIRHMIDSHPNQYFACLNCQSRFSSTSELAEHKHNVCEKQKPHYRNKLRQKTPKKTKSHKIDSRHEFRQDNKEFSENHGFNGIVISCELKPSHVHDEADIEDNIPTNLILPPSKSLANAPVIEKNAVIVLDDLQWNKRIPSNFNFHNTDADQILSRLGVVHRGPRTGEPNRRDWLKIIDETNQKFERCFDTSFYSKVASNVQENLAKFLDGSCNFNPDPDNTIKTRKLKNSVAINTAEGFPILLAFEQYSRNVFDGYMPRSIAPKHKWKWDNLEHDKTLCPEQIKRDSHANNCIITLVSSLDIWTQLCMRQKFEDKFKTAPIEKKAEKQNIIGKELKEILEKRELPTPSSQVVKFVNSTVTKRDDLEFPASLGLAPATPNHDIKPAVLSGEWVRPRCYICCACGFQARDSRALSAHTTTQHPNAQIQHYEIVGERLLNSDISKHLYVPPSQVNNRTRPLRGYRECTKCKKSVSLEDLHQHMLDCAGDTPTVRRKCRARPFGVRKRRTRLPDNTIRKKIRKDIRTRDRHRKTLIRPRQKNRSDVGDAETIRKMLADLPAKRHRVLVNPLNSNLRPRRKFDKQRNKLKIKKNITDDANKKTQGNVQSSTLNFGIERLKKVANLKEADSRMMKSNSNQVSNRQSGTPKRNSPLTTKRNLRLRESKGTSDQGNEGKKCADSGNNSGSTQSGSGGSGEAPFNTRENGNQSHNSNVHDNQQPGCSRQNDNNSDSSGQPPNVPLKHSIARLTANSGTHDKSVQFHHLFLVQQECNNIPQHVPTRQNILFENEAVVTKLDKPPLNYNHGGTMDPMAQKSKSNKPRKGLNDCIAMLKNKLVEPSSQEQVSIPCDLESPSTSKTPAKNIEPSNQSSDRSKVTHEIAIQCADLDSDEPLAQALMKERRASQRQQALANIAKLPVQGDDRNSHPILQERLDVEGEGSSKKDKAKSITPNIGTPKKQMVARSNEEKSKNNDSIVEKDMDNIKVQTADSHEVALSVPLLKGQNDCQQEITKTHKDKEKVPRTRADNNLLVSAASICQNNDNINLNNKEKKKQNVTSENPEFSELNILPKKKRKLKGDLEMSRKEKPIIAKVKPNLEKKEKITKEVQKKSKVVIKKLSNAEGNKVTEQKLIVQEKSHSQKASVPLAVPAKQTEIKKINPKINKNKPEIVSLLNNEVQNVTADKLVTIENPDVQKSVDTPVITTEVIKNEIKNPKKTQCSIPVISTKAQKIIPEKQKSDEVNLSRHEMEAKKCDQKSLNILETEKLLPEIPKTDSIINLEKENSNIVTQTQTSNEYHQKITYVNATISTSDTKPQASYVQPIINTESGKPNEEDTCVYNLKPMPQNLSIQDSCEDLSLKEQPELRADIPPAHCNIQMDSVLPVPLDLSGKISSTQSDSPVPYPISTYDDTYETLDLSNKYPNRDSTFNRVFIEEDVVDLRVKYPTHMHYESDLSISSIPEEATDLSIGNEQLPKDLSLKGKSCSSSRISAMQGADYLNIGSNRSHYESCTTSKAYDENSCLDFSIKETTRINLPTDLSGKRENLIVPLVSTSSHTESRSTLESNNIHVSATTNISNTVNLNNSRMNTYSTYNNLSIEGTSSHSDRIYINATPITSLEHVPKESFESAINLLKRNAYIEPEVLSTPQELPKDYYLPTMPNVSCIDMSKNNENFTAGTKMPLGLSESVNTSIPEYNLSNRITSTKKYESTTPVYTHANACISISKVETNNSNSFTNTLMSIPGSTITNTTSVYTLAGTTTSTPINYTAECNPMAIDVEPQSLKNVNDIRESSIQKTNKSIETVATEEQLPCEMERKLENLEQDPDIAKKIALLPKELVEILGTMPVDHRKQLLNVLPQYVSTASKSTTQSSNIDQSNPQKCVTLKHTSSPDLNKTGHTNLDTKIDKRQHLDVPTTPPSTLSTPLSQLSPTSISSSFLLTPPTPNIGRHMRNEQKDLKTADCESYNNINIIDLTEDDNCLSMPEAEVHTTTEITNVQPFTSKNNDKQSVPPISNATKINNDKTTSLRAVRIKTQSERQRSAFPDLEIRKGSSEVPVISLPHIDASDKVDTKGLKIQQGEISSSQCINRNVECEISSSVSINIEPEVKSNVYLKVSEKDIQPNMIVGTSCEVGSKQILTPGYKRYDVCSTTLDKSIDSDDIKNNVQVSNLSPPIQSDKIISNNNNNVVLKSKSKDDESMTIQVGDATSKQIIKSSEDDDSDDDVSLAVIVKQRNRDRSDVKSDKHPIESDIITNINSVTSSVCSAEIKTDTSVALKTNKIPEKPQSIIAKNSSDPSKNCNSNTEVKNKKKSRKTRRNNNLSGNKILQQPIDSNFDINKENAKTLDSENRKPKENNIKQMPKDLDSGCVSSSNSENDLILHSNDKHNNEILEEYDIPKKNVSIDEVSQADSSVDKMSEKKFLEPTTDSQTSVKSSYHKSLQETVKPDISDLHRSISTKVVTKQVEIKTPSTENTEISYVGPVEKERLTKLDEDSKESITETLQQLNTVTPLRRSRRGKSLFIDSKAIVNNEESTLSVDTVSEQKMPLTKKQLIFSKLLLDEEHNVAPTVSNNCEKIDDYVVTGQNLNNEASVDQYHIIQNDLSDSEIEPQTDLATKTNKRKKAVQVKRKNKKKKLQQQNSTSIEDKNQLEDDNISMSKTGLKLRVLPKSIEKLQDDIEISKESPKSVKSSLTTDKEELLLKKNKDVIDNTMNPTCIVFDHIQNKQCSVEKRKPDIPSDSDSATSSLPKKSKVNDIKKDELVPKKQEDILTKKVLINLDPTVIDNKAKTRTTCYNKPVAAKRPRSKSVFVNSSDYYDPYDIDLEEMNETPETLNRKVSLRKPNSSKTRKAPPAANLSTKSDIKNKRVFECDAVPSTSKTVTDVENTQNKEENDLKASNKTLTETKDSICDSDDSSKSDVPLKKYVEEKERKISNTEKKSNTSKQVECSKGSNVATNSKTKKKVKRSSVLNNKTDDTKIQNLENEAQLRSEQFMESFGFFSERKPRKSNLLATKKISETLHIIANETDDVYFGLKERSNKKMSEKKHADEEKNKGISNSKETKQDKKAAKRGRKKKNSTIIECSYCQLCKKEFRRPDNFLRHQMSVGHVTKISEIELKIKVPPLEEEPNYLLAFKLQLDRVKMLHEKIVKRKKLSLPISDIIIPNLEEILADAKRSVREKQITNRELSRDQALFIDCCELLKASHNKNVRKIEKVRHCSSLNCTQSSTNELDWFSRSIDPKNDHKNDGDVDPITARNILESDEVRNLENDLISGLQEAAKATKRNIATFNFDNLREIIPDGIIKLATCGLVNENYGKIEKEDKLDQPKIAPKRSPEYKEKMYPDINIESIDMFEDKFDKIKRKCRSQAAAASKQPQATPEANASYKVRKNKKKGKKKIRNHQNTVLTKAALKGFDGIKVSIVTTEINMSGIMTSARKSSKRKKKNQSKRKRERKSSEVSNKAHDSRQDDLPQKKLDIYEFMDTDDAEVFDFRPSTIMERFKSISNKELPSTSKNIGKYDEADVSSDSASDGDDFVYMSDDYVCSDNETENSIISCEIKNIMDQKKSPHKRKDTTEKSAVMGKIFKHNALRTEKKISKSKEFEQPKANLDQLFDSLLEEQPQPANETVTSKSNENSSQRNLKTPSPKATNKSNNDDEYDINARDYDDDNFYRDNTKDDDIDMQSYKIDRRSTCSNKKHRSITPIKRPSLYAIKPVEDHDIKANKYKDTHTSLYSERSITKNISSACDEFDTFSKRKEIVASPASMDESNSDDTAYNLHKSTEKSRDSKKSKSLKSHDMERRVSFDCYSESLDATNMSDDAGVARQRVRRKCTVGKQNILAETWSSESEPDGMPPRPNSAESVVGTNRRRKGRKKEGHSGKKLKLVKRTELESRVSKSEYENTRGGFARPGPSLTAQATVKSRRPAPYYWSEGEEEQEHVQQHGWIVGDSHKKLVTMLAHAKGRKRDDKRSVVE